MFRETSTLSQWDTGCHTVTSDRFDEVLGTNFTSARPMRHWVSNIASNYPMRHWVPYWCVWLDPCIRQSPGLLIGVNKWKINQINLIDQAIEMKREIELRIENLYEIENMNQRFMKWLEFELMIYDVTWWIEMWYEIEKWI